MGHGRNTPPLSILCRNILYIKLCSNSLLFPLISSKLYICLAWNLCKDDEKNMGFLLILKSYVWWENPKVIWSHTFKMKRLWYLTLVVLCRMNLWECFPVQWRLCLQCCLGHSKLTQGVAVEVFELPNFATSKNWGNIWWYIKEKHHK